MMKMTKLISDTYVLQHQERAIRARMSRDVWHILRARGREFVVVSKRTKYSDGHFNHHHTYALISRISEVRLIRPRYHTPKLTKESAKVLGLRDNGHDNNH
jgi:hypothetical protein